MKNQKSYKTWLEMYEDWESVEDFKTTGEDFDSLLNNTSYEDNETNEIMNTLAGYPVAAFIYAFAGDDGEIKLKIVHHTFKNIPFGMPFNKQVHKMYGIQGVGEDATAIEVSPSSLRVKRKVKSKLRA